MTQENRAAANRPGKRPGWRAFALLLLLSLPATMPWGEVYGRTGGPIHRSTQTPAGAGNKEELRLLEIGKPIRRELSGGEQHTYQVTLIAHLLLKVVVEQHGIDVAAQVLGPDGKQILEVDSENRPEGWEEVSVVAETTGAFHLIVRPGSQRAAAGSYQIRIEELRVATGADRELHDAHRLYEEARKLQGAGKYAEALTLARRALEIRERLLGSEHPVVAASLDSLAGIYNDRGEYAQSEPLSRRALAIREKALGKDHPITAESLDHLGVVCVLQGKYEEAEPLYRRALEIREQALGKVHPKTAESLNTMAVLYYSQGKYGAAEPLYRRALEIREQALVKDHPDTAMSLDNLADLLRLKRKYVEAESLYQRALEIRERALGRDHPFTAISLDGLVRIYQPQGKYQEAELLARRALAIREKALGEDHPFTLYSISYLASLCRALGKYEEAESLSKRALATSEKLYGKNHRRTAVGLLGLANIYIEAGKYVEAEPLCQRALEIMEQTLGKDHPDTDSFLNNLALLYSKEGKDAEAEALFRRVLKIRERAQEQDNPDTAINLTNLAVLYRKQGKFEEAEALHRRALEIREKALGQDHPDLANSLTNLAVLYQEQGKYAGVEQLYQRALAIYEKALGKNHPDTASCLSNLAVLYRRQGRYAEAEPLYQRALAVYEKVLGRDHPVIAANLNNLSMLYLAKGDPAQAVKFQALANASSESNLARNLIIGSERTKLAYLAVFSQHTDWTISLHLRSAPADPVARNLAATMILQRKGRALDAASQNLNALRSRFNVEDQALLDRLTETRSQLARLVLRGPQRLNTERHQALIKTLEEQAEKDEAEISRRSNEFRVQYLPITLESVRAAIPSDAALIEFASYHPFNAGAANGENAYGQPRYVAYVLRREGEIEWKELGEAKGIDQAIAALRKALRDPARLDVKRLARAVDARVFRPLRPLLGDARRLLISPDGSLNLIPFPALVDERGRYAVERYAISYLTSGRDLLRLQVDRKSRDGLLLVAGPDFGRRSRVVAERAAEPEVQEQPARSVLGEIYFQPLPGAVEEGEALRALLPGATLLTRRQATKAALYQAQGPRLLHIATHGFFLEDQQSSLDGVRGYLSDGDNPARLLNRVEESGLRIENPLLRSGLVLAGANEHREDDNGILTALEVTGLNLWGTKLVVLSACDTGVGEVKNGDGVYGLRRALVLAGAETQVMSLWAVADQATRELMVSYYRKLQQGKGRGEALREVQLEMLKRADRRHPFYWASFIQSGAWTNLNGQ